MLRDMTLRTFVAQPPLWHARSRFTAGAPARSAHRVSRTSTSCARLPRAQLSEPSSVRTSQPQPVTTASCNATFTSLLGNSFLVTCDELNLLVDPWLCDELIFFHPAFFRARKPWSKQLTEALDLERLDAIVLTQALPDHAHVPTLNMLPKHIPVIAPPSARALLTSLRFENLFLLPIGHTVSPFAHAPLFNVRALKGAIVGPPWSTPENAYIFTFQHSQHSVPFRVYHEPHGTFDRPSLAPYVDKLDVVVFPVMSAKLVSPIGSYTLVNGSPEALKCCEYVRPKTCVLFNNASGQYSGFLQRVLTVEGDAQSFTEQVNNHRTLRNMNVVFPQIGAKPYALDVPSPSSS